PNLLPVYPDDFTTRKQVRTGSILLVILHDYFIRRSSDRLHPLKHPVIGYVIVKSLPGLTNHREVFIFVQHAVVYSPCKCIAKECRTACFRMWYFFSVQEAWTPETVFALNLLY